MGASVITAPVEEAHSKTTTMILAPSLGTYFARS